MIDFEYYERRIHKMEKCYKGCFFSFIGTVILLIILLLTSCKHIEYVPVETVRTNTVIETQLMYDSIHVHDSVYIKEKGDTVLIERWHTKFVDRLRTDTMYCSRTDSIQVPYPVEKKLTRWQQICIDYGKIMLGATVLLVIFIIVWIARRLGKRLHNV